MGAMLCAGLAGGGPLYGQIDAARVAAPQDWSHRHVVFPQPQTFDRLSEVQQDQRYWHQVFTRAMRSAVANGSPRGSEKAMEGVSRSRLVPPAIPRTPLAAASKPDVDWGESLAGTVALSYSGLNSYPAKYSFNTNNPVPDCTNDFVVFTAPVSTVTRFNLFAFKNLYVNNSGTGSCSGTLPTMLFAYNASQNSGNLSSSPTLSLDGTQIAFIENSAPAQFHVVKWRSGNVSGTFGSPYNAAKMVNCAGNGAVAPCEWSLLYSTATGHATLSAPFIDYLADTAYLSDDVGQVYAVKPVFGGGAPSTQWVVAISGSTTMTPPVYDSVSKNVFVADANGKLYYIRTSASSAGTCLSGSPPCQGSNVLTVASGKPVVEAPYVDSTNGKVFVFSNSSPTGANASVVQTNTTLSTTSVANIGTVGANPVYGGAFSNSYYTSTGTGVLYACGAGPAQAGQLFGITFTGSTMNAGTPAYGPLNVSTAKSTCSPLTEVYNQSLGVDELYLSVQTKCTATITGGCLRQYNISSGLPASDTNTVAESGGTTGIIIDNVKNGLHGDASETNLYFVTLGAQSCSKHTDGTAFTTGNCAVKLTQSALQ